MRLMDASRSPPRPPVYLSRQRKLDIIRVLSGPGEIDGRSRNLNWRIPAKYTHRHRHTGARTQTHNPRAYSRNFAKVQISTRCSQSRNYSRSFARVRAQSRKRAMIISHAPSAQVLHRECVCVCVCLCVEGDGGEDNDDNMLLRLRGRT